MKLGFKRREKGFTLVELMVVMGIMAVMAGIVAGGVAGVGTKGQMARLVSDENTIGTSVDRFYSEGFPQVYPVEFPADLEVGRPEDVGVIVWDYRLPQDPTQSFIPDYLKEIPDSAALVSWRFDLNTGTVFYAQDGVGLIPPSTAELDVTADNTAPSDYSLYTVTYYLKKYEAAPKEFNITIPAGYSVVVLTAGTEIGHIHAKFLEDNPWSPGNVLTYTGTITATSDINKWKVKISHLIADGGTGTFDVYYDLIVATPTPDTPGKIVWDFDTAAGDIDGKTDPLYWVEPSWHNSSQEFTIMLGEESDLTSVGLIKNPSTKKVYRWLVNEHTSIDTEGIFKPVAGQQAVVIK